MVVAEENIGSSVRHLAGDISECIFAAVMLLMEGWMAVYIDRASKIVFFFELKQDNLYYALGQIILFFSDEILSNKLSL